MPHQQHQWGRANTQIYAIYRTFTSGSSLIVGMKPRQTSIKVSTMSIGKLLIDVRYISNIQIYAIVQSVLVLLLRLLKITLSTPW
jgi:hypothetical protein